MGHTEECDARFLVDLGNEIALVLVSLDRPALQRVLVGRRPHGDVGADPSVSEPCDVDLVGLAGVRPAISRDSLVVPDAQLLLIAVRACPHPRDHDVTGRVEPVLLLVLGHRWRFLEQLWSRPVVALAIQRLNSLQV